MSERRIARTKAIGLRRDPQPPKPIVIPLRSSPTTSSSDFVLSRLLAMFVSAFLLGCVLARLAGGDELVAVFVGHAEEVEFEGVALLEAVAALDVHRVDAVDGFLGAPDDAGVLGGDLRGDLASALVELLARDHVVDAAELLECVCVDALCGV